MRATGTPHADSSRTESEQRRYEELERAVSSLEATTAIAQALGGETDLGVVLDLIAGRGQELVDAGWTAILILDGDELELRATAGDIPARPIGERYPPVRDSVAGRTLRSRKTQIVTDLSNHPSSDEDRALVKTLGTEHALFVPLDFRGRAVGILVVAAASGAPGFTEAQQQLLEAFAASAATAVATAQSVAADRLRQSVAAAEQERRRWARELHDETLQELGAVRMLLDTAIGRKRPEELGEVVERVAESLDQTIAGLHRMIAELRPATLDELGVGASVVALAERRRTPGLDVSVSVDLDYEAGRAPTRLALEVESAIYRIVQEALANVSKHAHAACAEIELTESDGQVVVEVRDDGRGMVSSDTSGSGLGLAGMRERVMLLGGTLYIDSEPGEGTVVHATMPAVHAQPHAGG